MRKPCEFADGSRLTGLIVFSVDSAMGPESKRNRQRGGGIMSKKDKDKAKDNAKSQADVKVVEEDTQRKRIEELLDDGYTPVQIEKEWGYPHSTVREIAKKKLLPKGKAGNGEGEVPKLPVVLKAGGGQEVISPEAILQGYLLSDGDAGAWMLKGFMLYRAAQLAVMSDVEIMKGQAEAQAKAIKPVLDVMEQARKDMDAAAARARDSSIEIAQAAAAGAAARATVHIDERFDQLMEKKADIATVQDPIKGLMARTMEMLMTQITGQMFGGQQIVRNPGLADNRGQGGT